MQVCVRVCLYVRVYMTHDWALSPWKAVLFSLSHINSKQERECVYVHVWERSNLESKREIQMRADCGSLAVYSMWCVASYLFVQHLLDCCDHLSILLAWGVLCLNVCLQVRLCLYVSCSRYVCKCARVCSHLHHLCMCACVCVCVCVCLCMWIRVLRNRKARRALPYHPLCRKSYVSVSLSFLVSFSLSLSLPPPSPPLAPFLFLFISLSRSLTHTITHAHSHARTVSLSLFVTHANAHESVMSHMNESCHIWINHVIYK